MAIVLDGTGSITGLTSGAGIAAAALSGQVPDANAPSGSVIQVVQSIDNATASFAFSATQSSGFPTVCSATITPSSANSKILVIATCSIGPSSAGGLEAAMAIERNGTLADGANNTGGTTPVHASGGPIGSAECAITLNAHVLDSPATTSALTYKIRWIGGEGATYYVNRTYNTTGFNFYLNGGSNII